MVLFKCKSLLMLNLISSMMNLGVKLYLCIGCGIIYITIYLLIYNDALITSYNRICYCLELVPWVIFSGMMRSSLDLMVDVCNIFCKMFFHSVVNMVFHNCVIFSDFHSHMIVM